MAVSLLTLACGILTIFYFIYRYFVKHFDYFEKQGIQGPKPVPFFGSWWGVWNKQYHEDVILHRQKKYGKIYGTFDGRRPNTVIADPKLLRNILVKDFDHFINRPEFEPNHRLINLNVGSLKDERWKEVRSAMTGAFSSAKLKNMVPSMNECAVSMLDHLNSQILKTSSQEFNLKEITVGFSLDVIASCVFGMKLKSIRTPNDPFVSKALKSVQEDRPLISKIVFILTAIYPKLAKQIPASAFTELDFFLDVSKNILKDKKANPSPERTDFLELLLQSSMDKSGKSPFTDEDMILAQVLVFLLAGFDTPSTALGTVLHCLTMNQSVQDKLRVEVLNGIKKHGGINYEFSQDVPYMDQCIAESLRLHPTNSKTDRICSKTVVYDKIKIEKGTAVTIPIYAIHRNPENYPQPEKFDPERFNSEEKTKRDPMTYIPFGSGPRGCLGRRFANEQLKIGISHLVTNYKLIPNKKTNDPPKYLNGCFTFFAIVAPELWVSLEKLN